MSRVGKKPISVDSKTQVTYADKHLSVKGVNGTLSRDIHPAVDLDIAGNQIAITMAENTRGNRALQGMTRSLVANMVIGVEKGFQRILEINGIGYRATVSGSVLQLNLGFSHPVDFQLPDGVSAAVDKNNVITLSSIDKEKLGQTAASIRALRPPEPYKGKGIKYSDEYIQRKAGKTGTK